MEKNNQKIAHTTWWIFSIIGVIIGLINSDSSYRDSQPIAYAFLGLVNGALIGWFFGYIIDQIKNSSTVQHISKKIEEDKENKTIIENAKSSLAKYNDARHRFQYLSNETLIHKYQTSDIDNCDNMEQLALEEELVKRNVLNHSPMHEKMEKINNYFKS